MQAMLFRRLAIIYCGLFVGLFGSGYAQADTNESTAHISFKDCQIQLDAVELDAQCSSFLRPEDPQKPNGKQIELFVTKIAAHSSKAEADAFTLIQGGPGGSSIDMLISYYPILQEVLQKRDLIVVDQRGTGRSNILACEQPSEEQLQTVSFDPVETAENTKKCIEKNHSADLKLYTTSIAVQDLDAVREAAGYEKLTVYGTSYGTRVAQHYMRRFPKQTRAVILDGVVHVGLNLAGGEIARRSQGALDSIFKRCQADEQCAEQFGDLDQKFNALKTRLEEQVVEISLPHPVTAKTTTQKISVQHLYAAVRLMPYSTEGIALLPLLISQAYDGDYTLLAAQAMNVEESFSDGYAIGMQNSVMCAEDFPFTQESDKQNLDSTYFGNTMVEALAVTCKHWPRGVMDDDFRSPFKSNIPVLILSGETDPITPPENGEKALAMFDNSKHIVVPAHGHGVLSRGCMPALVSEFIEHSDLEQLNSACVEREREMPIFIDNTGPRP